MSIQVKRLLGSWLLSGIMLSAQGQTDAPMQADDDAPLPVELLEFLAEWQDQQGEFVDLELLDGEFYELEASAHE